MYIYIAHKLVHYKAGVMMPKSNTNIYSIYQTVKETLSLDLDNLTIENVWRIF
jgi:hypothetical protein